MNGSLTTQMHNCQGAAGKRWTYSGGSHFYLQEVRQYAQYRFTGKELDKETGLYYFGARYYDARISRWVSADPALDKYLPGGNKEEDLPGRGIYRPSNLGMYVFTSNNPINYIDPDGNWDKRIHYWDPYWGGTKAWVQQSGFNSKQAERIAKACNAVDYISSGKSYINGVGDPSYHFDTNWESDLGHGIRFGPDTRKVHAEKHLAKAVKLMKESISYRNNEGGLMGWIKNKIADYKEGQALDELGTGLHALQDIYAHNQYYQQNLGGLFFHDSPELTGRTNEADDPSVDRERVKRTEQATKEYLQEFFKKVNEK